MSAYFEQTPQKQAANRAKWIFLLLTVLSLYWMLSEHRRVQRNQLIAIDPATTTGSVAYVHWGKGGSWFYYAYGVGGHVYQEKSQSYAPFPGRPQVGAPLTVTYSISHPDWSVAGTLAAQDTSEHTVALMIMALVCASVAFAATRVT